MPGWRERRGGARSRDDGKGGGRGEPRPPLLPPSITVLHLVFEPQSCEHLLAELRQVQPSLSSGEAWRGPGQRRVEVQRV